MASNKLQRFGPTLMVTGATGSNYINPAASGANAVGYTSTASYAIIRHIRVTNLTNATQGFSLFVGGTTGSATGTAFMSNGSLVPATGSVDWYGALRLDAADFLSGTAVSGSALVIEAEGELGLA